MQRRDFVRAIVIGTCGAAGLGGGALAGPSTPPGSRALGLALARATVTTSRGLPRMLAVTATEVRAAITQRRTVHSGDYFATFGLRPVDLGVPMGDAIVVTTTLPDALAELVAHGEHFIAVWDGVAYRLEVA